MRHLLACSKIIYPAGPQLSEKAKEIAATLGKPDFKASNGWLDKWKSSFNITQKSVAGESGDVNPETVFSWKERLPVIVSGYANEDIYNFHETGCFWRALPDRGFGQRGKKCKGGKHAKQRFTIALLVNAAGGKEKPFVIWTSEKHKCFKSINKNSLPVKYFHQSKAWMTSEIFESILSTWNQCLRAKSRSVLLLVDNAACHPKEFQGIKASSARLRLCTCHRIRHLSCSLLT